MSSVEGLGFRVWGPGFRVQVWGPGFRVHPAVALCLGPFGDPRGVGVSYERGTPCTSENTLSSYRGTPLARKRTPLGPYSVTMPRALG